MIKPSIDLVHPTEGQGDLPAFQSIEEEAAFWDSHDLTDPTDLSELTDEDEQPADPAGRPCATLATLAPRQMRHTRREPVQIEGRPATASTLAFGG